MKYIKKELEEFPKSVWRSLSREDAVETISALQINSFVLISDGTVESVKTLWITIKTTYIRKELHFVATRIFFCHRKRIKKQEITTKISNW